MQQLWRKRSSDCRLVIADDLCEFELVTEKNSEAEDSSKKRAVLLNGKETRPIFQLVVFVLITTGNTNIADEKVFQSAFGVKEVVPLKNDSTQIVEDV